MPNPLRTEEEVNRLVKENERLVDLVVHRYVKRYHVPALEWEDLKSYGLIGLLQAARAWDPARGRFSTLACTAIERQIADAAAHTESLRARQAIPYRVPREAKWFVASLVLLAAAIWAPQLPVLMPPREREQVRAALAERGVQTGLHYPIPLHRQPAFAHLEIGEGAYPEAERAAAEVLSLPMYPHLTRAQVAYVADALRRALP